MTVWQSGLITYSMRNLTNALHKNIERMETIYGTCLFLGPNAKVLESPFLRVCSVLPATAHLYTNLIPERAIELDCQKLMM